MELTGPMYLALAIASSAAMTLFLKGFRADGTNRYAIILGNYFTCVILGFFLLKEKASVLHPAPSTLLFGALCGILFVFTLVMMQFSIEKNGAILSSAFSKLGLIIPLIMSIAFFGEKPKIVQYIGIAVVLAAVLIINGKKKEGQQVHPLLLILVLLGGGFADGMAKIFNQFGDLSQDDLYILTVFFTAGVITLVLLFLEYRKTGKTGRLKDYLAGILVGIPNYFSASLLLRSLSTVPAFIAYTVFSVGTILFITLVSMLVFKEKPTKYQWIGIALIVAALVLLNL